jgi:hypothetical protein
VNEARKRYEQRNIHDSLIREYYRKQIIITEEEERTETKKIQNEPAGVLEKSGIILNMLIPCSYLVGYSCGWHLKYGDSRALLLSTLWPQFRCIPLGLPMFPSKIYKMINMPKMTSATIQEPSQVFIHYALFPPYKKYACTVTKKEPSTEFHELPYKYNKYIERG